GRCPPTDDHDPTTEHTMTMNASSMPSAKAERAPRAASPKQSTAGSAPIIVTVPVTDPVTAPGGNIPPGTTFQQGQWAISPNSLYVLVLQFDGNLVLYQVMGAPPSPNSTFAGCALWATSTSTGATFAVQTDGNLVVYDSNSTPIWASNTP